MSNSDNLARARAAFASQAWSDSYTLFEAASAEAAVDPPDLKLMATAAALIGRHEEASAHWCPGAIPALSPCAWIHCRRASG